MELSRRKFLQATAALAAVGANANSSADLHIAPFHFDVTPPLGHPLCGGWIKPAEAVDDELEAIGIVLLGAEKPIVICAVDWTGLLNEAHVAWRQALAEAAGTTPERVAVQTVHQHNAPFACLDAEKIVAKHADLPHIIELDFFKTCLERARKAVSAAVQQPRRATQIASGQAKVDKVAGNRRVHRDANKKVLAMRGSRCTDAKLRALPEGLIDPWLKTVAFYEKDAKIAALHYYATHPMSYYGDGRVNSDFAGLARKRRQKEEPNCRHIYFTGCAGNVAAGKYNDGSKETRPVLTQRVYDGIVASEQNLKPEPMESLNWVTETIAPLPRADLDDAKIEAQIADKNNKVVERNRPAYDLAWLRRDVKKQPIVVSALHVNDISLLHLPAESFVEYQLRAQEMKPKRFVATAAYGDDGPWYIPTAEEYPNGGYEVSVAFCAPEVDAMLTKAMRNLLDKA